jgi:hypothetical protein
MRFAETNDQGKRSRQLGEGRANASFLINSFRANLENPAYLQRANLGPAFAGLTEIVNKWAQAFKR